MSVMRDAQAKWPEDEAQALAAQVQYLAEEEGNSYAKQFLSGQRAHMSTVFDNDDELNRFNARLDQLLPQL